MFTAASKVAPPVVEDEQRSPLRPVASLGQATLERAMATQLRRFDWDEVAPRNRKYDWDSWLNGRPWKLEFKQDFEVSIDSFRNAISVNARRRNMVARVTKVNDTTVIVQAFEMAKAKR